MNIYKKKIGKYVAFQMLFIISMIGKCQAAAEVTLRPPRKLEQFYWWSKSVVNKHFTNMTAELVKDALIKLRAAKEIQKRYKNKPMYQVGLITANMQTLFEKILVIYRDVSDLYKIRNRWWLDDTTCSAVNDTLNGMSIAQSYFNRIRLERRIFQNEMKERSQKALADKEEIEKKYGALPPGAPGMAQHEYPKGGMYSRRMNSDGFQIPVDEFGIPDFSLPNIPARIPKIPQHLGSRRNMLNYVYPNKKKDSRRGTAKQKSPPGVPKSFLKVNKELELSLQALKKRGRPLFGGAMPYSKANELDINHDSVKQPPETEDKHSYILHHSEKKKRTMRPTKKRIWKVGVI